MTGRRTLRIGTRGSRLALWQANRVAGLLAHHGYESDIVVVKTSGDRRQDVSLAEIGGKGLFIKELEEALSRNEVDLAVHSLKDVPTWIPPEFTLAAFLERADARDAFVSVRHATLADLPLRASIGTSSPRRQAEIRMRRPDLEVVPLRGNVDTRVQRVIDGRLDAAVLAAAGLTRLGLQSVIRDYFPVAEFVPAAGQGIVVIETAADDEPLAAAKLLTDPVAALAAHCERSVLQAFDFDCNSPVGVHAEVENGQLSMHAFVEVAGRGVTASSSAPAPDAEIVIADIVGSLAASGVEAVSGGVRP